MITDAGRLLNYEEGNTYDPRLFLPPFRYGSEGEWFHLKPAKLTKQVRNVETCILSLVKRAGIQLRQNGCMLKGPPPAGQPAINLETSCELGHSHLFAYFLIKLIMFCASFTLCDTSVLKTSKSSTTKRRLYTGTRLKNGVTML
jgi:hypothetical protein